MPTQLGVFQKLFVVAGIVAILGLTLFPPWCYASNSVNCGHSLFFMPPNSEAKIDAAQMLAQIVSVSIFISWIVVLGRYFPSVLDEKGNLF